MTPLYRSISSGSSSHKTVTKEQSWILWSYYNNSASPPTSSSFTRRPSGKLNLSSLRLTEHAVHLLRRERALLRRALRPRQLRQAPPSLPDRPSVPTPAPDPVPPRPRHPRDRTPLVAAGRRGRHVPHHGRQTDHQRRAVLQGRQDAHRVGPGGPVRRSARQSAVILTCHAERRIPERSARGLPPLASPPVLHVYIEQTTCYISRKNPFPLSSSSSTSAPPSSLPLPD